MRVKSQTRYHCFQCFSVMHRCRYLLFMLKLLPKARLSGYHHVQLLTMKPINTTPFFVNCFQMHKRLVQRIQATSHVDSPPQLHLSATSMASTFPATQLTLSLPTPPAQLLIKYVRPVIRKLEGRDLYSQP